MKHMFFNPPPNYRNTAPATELIKIEMAVILYYSDNFITRNVKHQYGDQ